MSHRAPASGTVRRAVIGTVLALALFAPAVAIAHDPIPTGTKRDFGGLTTTSYHLTGNPEPSSNPWFSTAVSTSLVSNFRAIGSNNSRVPTIFYASGGAGNVVYKTASTSPCGSGSPIWIQCASNVGANANWTIYVRNLSTSGPAGWTWWETGETCGSNSSTCWYLRRALIHEAGHAMLALLDMCTTSQPCRLETETVMNSDDPEVGTPGSLNFEFQKCDESAAQLVWDLASSGGEYGDCFDHVASAGVSGLRTNVAISGGTSFSACNGQAVLVSGRLEVSDFSAYGPLGANPLTGRTVWFDRGSTSHYTSTTATNASGLNWSKSFGGTNFTYNYVPHFDDATGDGLADSDQPSFSITWSSAC